MAPPAPVVLLVDDQAIVGEMVRRILGTQPDITFHFCRNAEAAVATAREQSPTVILQDLAMPGIDGMELLSRYQQDDDLRDVPVIVLSGKEDPKVKATAFAQGASDYIVKLPDPVELVARIRRHSVGYIHLVERRRTEAALRAAEAGARQAAAAAERAHHAKSAFLANVGHELRTPLNAIMGYTQMLGGNAGLSPEQGRAVAAIHDNAAELVQTIERILSVSHLGSEATPLEPEDFSLRALLAEVETAFRLRCDRKSLAWKTRVTVGEGTVHGDRRKLHQVLVHLLDNAVKFTASGQVRLEAQPVEAGHYRFDVVDTGPGIEPDRRAEVLAAFEQDGDIGPGGIGLGLTIAHRHTQELGGRLQIGATPGGGTTVTFEIPLEAPGTGAGGPAADELGEGAPPSGEGSEVAAELPADLRLPTPILRDLKAAVAAHSVSDLRAAVDAVEALGAACRPLAERLRHLSQRYDLAAIAALLREVSHD